jgi:hypothetical protein
MTVTTCLDALPAEEFPEVLPFPEAWDDDSEADTADAVLLAPDSDWLAFPPPLVPCPALLENAEDVELIDGLLEVFPPFSLFKFDVVEALLALDTAVLSATSGPAATAEAAMKYQINTTTFLSRRCPYLEQQQLFHLIRCLKQRSQYYQILRL